MKLGIECVHVKDYRLQLETSFININNTQHTQPFYGSLDFVRDNPGEPAPEETFTHSQLLWSLIAPYLLQQLNSEMCGRVFLFIL